MNSDEGDARAGVTLPLLAAGDPPAGVGSMTAGSGVVLGGRYRLREQIGYGGSADVYAGTDELLDRPVAVKVFKAHLSDPVNLARQRSEMRLLARLNHRHLVTIHDAWVPTVIAGETGSSPLSTDGSGSATYLVMELVSGRTLADRLASGPLSEPAVRALAVQMADALSLIHSEHLVHRDIKPANILLTGTGIGTDPDPDPDPGIAKLSDFGIARMVDAAPLTSTQDVIGTAAYLSPEQVMSGDVSSPTDVYALGLVLLESLTGQREFPGPAWESALARLRRSPMVPPTLPPPWPTVLTAMTAADPVARPTAAEILLALRRPTRARGLPPVGPPVPPPVESDATRVDVFSDIGGPRDVEVARAGSAVAWTALTPRTLSRSGRHRRIGWAATIGAVAAAVLLFTTTHQDGGTSTPAGETTTSQQPSESGSTSAPPSTRTSSSSSPEPTEPAPP
ncbi:MAG: serine/threonine-protein kinase, partial [Nakamurella sp.]